MMKGEAKFQEEYQKLNTSQKEAVETLEGPVMVIAGPGTGKTQVLALRIANILRETDTPADGILCLTFTNSGVRAMRERLQRLIGSGASRVTVATFHAFAGALIEEFYETLSLPQPPALLDERDSVLLADELLEENEWEYLRPRSGGAHNFRDLRSLISFLKRETMTPEQFIEEVGREIENVRENPENISSRGATKGNLKKEALEKIERLNRTLEAGRFYALYEQRKKEENLADYDDILKLALELVRNSSDARASVAERYLYVLVDEHQDSSGVQNQFLESVWGEVEKPNLFVVGDDRQLIYGFGGASLSHFESFRETFSGTKLITLTENYRSTQTILDAADELLASTLAQGKLKGQGGQGEKLKLVEAEYERDEILSAGLMMKEKLAQGWKPQDCALLVPKNSQVKSAIAVLSDLGLPVASSGKSSLFALSETRALLSVMKVLAEPFDSSALATLLLQKQIPLPIFEVHKFLHEHGSRLSLERLSEASGALGQFGETLLSLLEASGKKDVYELIQEIGQVLFFRQASESETLLREVEVVRTMLHLTLSRLEKNPKTTLTELMHFIERLEEYGEDIPLALFSADQGVKVMTLHASKGLEYRLVWIAHLEERSLMGGRANGFALPSQLSESLKKKDEATARRELYVALTRAREECVLSYATKSYSGGDLSLSRIIMDLPEEIFEKSSAFETEARILSGNQLSYVSAVEEPERPEVLSQVQTLVSEHHAETPLSVTHLNNFFGCPWRWYFRNFIRLPEPTSEALVFGSFMHVLAEESLALRSARGEDLALKIENALNSLRVFEEAKRRRFKKDAEKALELFHREILPHISVEASAEHKLNATDPTTGLRVTGKLDLLENFEEGLRVTDFKTGRPKKDSEIEKLGEDGRLSDYLRQLTMYSYLLENQRQKKTASASRLVFLEAKEEKDFIYETEISEKEMRLLVKDIQDYHQALSGGEWVERTCLFKPNQFEKECPYCALKKRLFE